MQARRKPGRLRGEPGAGKQTGLRALVARPLGKRVKQRVPVAEGRVGEFTKLTHARFEMHDVLFLGRQLVLRLEDACPQCLQLRDLVFSNHNVPALVRIDRAPERCHPIGAHPEGE